MAKTRREFTAEFKREAVALWETSGRPQMEIAAELGLQPSQLRRWQRLIQQGQLSRSPKVLQQLSEPEVFGCHAGLATRLLRRQPQNPGCGISGQSIDGRGLPVGRYNRLSLRQS